MPQIAQENGSRNVGHTVFHNVMLITQSHYKLNRDFQKRKTREGKSHISNQGSYCNVTHIFSKICMLRKIAIPKDELRYMTYLSDMLQTCDSKEIDVFTFQEKNMGKINDVMDGTSVSFRNDRDQAENFYYKM